MDDIWNAVKSLKGNQLAYTSRHKLPLLIAPLQDFYARVGLEVLTYKKKSGAALKNCRKPLLLLDEFDLHVHSGSKRLVSL